jgi:DinB family protein
MIELYKNTIRSQLNAALAMFNDAVIQCPDPNWAGNVGNHAFWHVAYHTLFFTDLYLGRDDESFEPPEFYREDYHFLGKKPFPPYEEVVADQPYTKDTILEYVEICRSKAPEAIASETAESLAGPSGFFWYEVPRAELYLISIRHVQHHAAQMSLYLRKVAGIGIDWVGNQSVMTQ